MWHAYGAAIILPGITLLGGLPCTAFCCHLPYAFTPYLSATCFTPLYPSGTDRRAAHSGSARHCRTHGAAFAVVAWIAPLTCTSPGVSPPHLHRSLTYPPQRCGIPPYAYCCAHSTRQHIPHIARHARPLRDISMLGLMPLARRILYLIYTSPFIYLRILPSLHLITGILHYFVWCQRNRFRALSSYHKTARPHAAPGAWRLRVL